LVVEKLTTTESGVRCQLSIRGLPPRHEFISENGLISLSRPFLFSAESLPELVALALKPTDVAPWRSLWA
jgi:hypothetical protein